mmetsp:Transcript_98250/g.204914  ORF Transcript_98250/g.204914 Transcript_98250/m.204914 type:complete len:220 (+) Transcript_98250:134-793(+)
MFCSEPNSSSANPQSSTAGSPRLLQGLAQLPLLPLPLPISQPTGTDSPRTHTRSPPGRPQQQCRPSLWPSTDGQGVVEAQDPQTLPKRCFISVEPSNWEEVGKKTGIMEGRSTIFRCRDLHRWRELAIRATPSWRPMMGIGHPRNHLKPRLGPPSSLACLPWGYGQRSPVVVPLRRSQTRGLLPAFPANISHQVVLFLDQREILQILALTTATPGAELK